MTLPIGLLYDHTHPNFGDQAIGLALEQTLSKHGLPYRTVPNTGLLDPESYAAVVVGGGHGLRAPGDDFYDRFRLHGRHILNTMGVSRDCGDMNYLKNYRYVSVRSTGDYGYLECYRPDTSVAPCMSLALDATAPGPVFPKLDKAILIHMNQHHAAFIPDWFGVVRRAFPDHELVLVSITPYNNDKEYLSEIAADRGIQCVHGLTPIELAAFIGQEGVHAVFSSSLHASLFAYRAGKPFLVHAYYEKVNFFLQERGLLGRQWTSLLDPEAIRARVKPGPDPDPTYRECWLLDQVSLRTHIERVIRSCEYACDGG
jgi:hypothetical protein